MSVNRTLQAVLRRVKKNWSGNKTPQFWSYSRYGQYKTCPLQYFHSAVLKIRTPANAAMERGTDIHKKAEYFLNGTIKVLPDELRRFKTEFRALKRAGADPEAGVALTKDWQLTHMKDWDGVWVRCIADADVVSGEEATTIDFKTGRQYPSHNDQGHLLATTKFAVLPAVKTIDVEFWYLDSGEVASRTYHRKDAARMRRAWTSRATKMLSDTTFKPTPGNHCKRCQYRDDKMGGCTAWRKGSK